MNMKKSLPNKGVDIETKPPNQVETLQAMFQELMQKIDQRAEQVDSQLHELNQKVASRSVQSLVNLTEALEKTAVIAQTLQPNVNNIQHAPVDNQIGGSSVNLSVADDGDADDGVADDGVDDADVFRIGVTITIAVLSLVATVMAWQISLVSADDGDRAGLNAALNVVTTQFVNDAVLYERQRAYGRYILNDKLQDKLQEEIEQDITDPEQRGQFQERMERAGNMVATNQQFFPSKYLNRDGSYNAERDLGEAWAQAEQFVDLKPKESFEFADEERARELVLITAFIVLSVALLFFTLSEAIYPSRVALRYGSTVIGVLFMIVSVIMMLSVWTFGGD